MEVKELGHVVLYVRDVGVSARFYREVLGWRQILPAPGAMGEMGRQPIAAFNAPSGRTHHELLLIEVGQDAAAQPEGRRVGLYHFGVRIGTSDDDLRAALAELTASGTPVLGASDHHATHSLYIADPDGNEIELYVDIPGVDWESPGALGETVRPLNL